MQNGRDCGSTRIDINVKDSVLEIINNGSPMSLDVMQNVLLSLGGSQKEEGAVGGFGQAKNLLYFRWDDWEVSSGENNISGSGPTYGDPSSQDFFHGTKSTILLENVSDNHTLQGVTREYLKKCFLGSCHTYLNGERIQGREHRGRILQELHYGGEPFARVYFNKQRNDDSVRVYVGGLYMFSTGYVENLKGAVSIELLKSSTELLTANRDGLRFDYRYAVQQFVRELTKDQEKMVKEKSEQVWFNNGGGEIEVGQTEAFAETFETFMQKVETINKEIHVAAKTTLKPTNVKIEVGVALISETEASEPEVAEEPKPEPFAPSMVDHDYVVIKEADCTLTNSRIKAILGSDRAKVLFVQWTNILQTILEAIEFKGKFTPGLVFGETTEALYRVQNGRTCLLFNPQVITKGQSSRCQLDQMMQLAVHEICHIKESYHDTDFVNAYHRVWTKAMKRYADLQKFAYGKVSKSLKS